MENLTTTPRTIAQIKEEKQQKVDALIDSCGMFFAFSNSQLSEGIAKHPLTLEGDKYVNMGAGAFLAKSKVDEFLNGLEAINKWYKVTVKANKQRKANIAYELNNHEAFYTGSIEDTLNSLGSDYSAEEVQAEFNKLRKTHVEL